MKILKILYFLIIVLFNPLIVFSQQYLVDVDIEVVSDLLNLLAPSTIQLQTSGGLNLGEITVPEGLLGTLLYSIHLQVQPVNETFLDEIGINSYGEGSDWKSNIGSTVINATLLDDSGKSYSSLTHNVSFNLLVNASLLNSNKLCLGYINLQTLRWSCQDYELTRVATTSSVSGQTNHFTSFAMIVDPNTQSLPFPNWAITIIIVFGVRIVVLIVVLVVLYQRKKQSSGITPISKKVRDIDRVDL